MAKRRDFHEIYRGLIVAAQLGFGEAFEAALESFAALPAVRGNAVLEKSTVEGVLLPIGEKLGNIMHASEMLEPLLTLATHHLAAVRCLAAGALPRLWENISGNSTVERLSKDARTEVRACLALALLTLPRTDRWDLVARWLHADSSRQRALALRILPDDPMEDALAVLSERHADLDHEVAEAAVEALSRLAEMDPGRVLKALATWSASANPQTAWVIAHTLARHPLITHGQEGMEILESLAAITQSNQSRHAIEVALRAMARKGESEGIRAALRVWKNAPDPNRKIIAGHVLRRLDESDE